MSVGKPHDLGTYHVEETCRPNRRERCPRTRRGAEEATTAALMELLRAQQEQQQAQLEQQRIHHEQQLEQQRIQQQQQAEQQRALMALIEQQREDLTRFRAQHAAPEEGKAAICLPRPTLQKLGADDDIEHFLATFERIAGQQGWPCEVWPTQLAGLLTGKALAAYASLSRESAASYDAMKKAILHRYDTNEEAHR